MDTPSWALITGGAGRGGAAISRALHARGLHVVIHHTSASQAKAQALCDELEALRPQSTQRWQADFTDPDLTIPTALAERNLTTLILNASVYQPSSLGQTDQYTRDYLVHVQAHARLLQALHTQALQSVVAITDIAVERPAPGYVSYNATKGALQSLVLTLAIDWAPQVRCNIVQPGTMPYPPDWQDAERAAFIEKTIPLQRLGTFEELASAVVYLALDASYITGQVLAVDGGRSRHLF